MVPDPLCLGLQRRNLNTGTKGRPCEDTEDIYLTEVIQLQLRKVKDCQQTLETAKTERKDYSSELSEGAWPCQHVISDEWLPEV